MKITAVNHAQVSIYVGSREGYEGEYFSSHRLRRIVSEFQRGEKEQRGDFVSARVSYTDFVAGDYHEGGVEITLFNYPRFPKEWRVLEDFGRRLAEYLLVALKQNRLTVVFHPPSSNGNATAVMFEQEDAQTTPDCFTCGGYGGGEDYICPPCRGTGESRRV